MCPPALGFPPRSQAKRQRRTPRPHVGGFRDPGLLSCCTFPGASPPRPFASFPAGFPRVPGSMSCASLSKIPPCARAGSPGPVPPGRPPLPLLLSQTIGAAFVAKVMTVGEQTVTLGIWVSAGVRAMAASHRHPQCHSSGMETFCHRLSASLSSPGHSWLGTLRGYEPHLLPWCTGRYCLLR